MTAHVSNNNDKSECVNEIPLGTQDNDVVQPYSAFTTWEKRLIVTAASLAIFVGPLTANIYIPALHPIATDLRVSDSSVNLTLTVYLVVQSIVQIFVAPISDVFGRRPVYLIGLAIYTVANCTLAVSRTYTTLMILRCFQSLGSGILFSGGGVVADCIVPAERGAYVGFTMLGAILGPSLSPVIGGVFSAYYGWRSIFWFLAAFGGAMFMAFLFFMPETCRKVVGDGSVPIPWYRNSYIGSRVSQRQTVAPFAAASILERPKPDWKVALGMWHVMSDIESLLIILYASFISAGYWCIAATMSAEFTRIYNLNSLQVGLCLLPIAAGGLAFALVVGKWEPLDRNYRRHAKRLGTSPDSNQAIHDAHFPIEKARLQVTSPLLIASCLLIILYGWLLQISTSIAGPLVVLFLIGFCMMGMGKTVQILLLDLHPDQPATAVASYNVTRTFLGAGVTAFIMPVVDSIGNGWAFTAVGISWLVFYPTIPWMQRYGPRLRARKQR